MSEYTDRELLELAAKAAGLPFKLSTDWHDKNYWNPLAESEDAFWLMVKLGLHLASFEGDDRRPAFANVFVALSSEKMTDVYEDHGSDPYAATRRAIVRAAAAIGELMHGRGEE